MVNDFLPRCPGVNSSGKLLHFQRKLVIRISSPVALLLHGRFIVGKLIKLVDCGRVRPLMWGLWDSEFGGRLSFLNGFLELGTRTGPSQGQDLHTENILCRLQVQVVVS